MTTRKDFLRGQPIEPKPITGRETVPELVDNAFLAYNGGRLAEGCRLFAERMLEDDVTVGMSLTGAMTPAGLGMSTIIPLLEAGFIDWMVSTGANLYHDAHFGLGLTMHRGTPFADDVELREEGVVRIYDIFFDYEVLLSTDAYIREVSAGPDFQRAMSRFCYDHNRQIELLLGETRKALLLYPDLLTRLEELPGMLSIFERDGRLQLRLVPQPRLDPADVTVTLDAPGWKITGGVTQHFPWNRVRVLSWKVAH